MSSSIHRTCPVCASAYMFNVTEGLTRRTKRRIPIFVCLECRSASNPSGYTEDADQLARDLQWNISVEQRNRRAGGNLMTALRSEGLRVSSVLEIGAGTGVVLSELAQSGIKVLGFDINPQAVEYGACTFGIDIRCEFWNDRTVAERFDLVLCISVLEHLPEPRSLLGQIGAYCSRTRAQAFVSVPFFEQGQWPFLLDTDPYLPGTPFFDNDVHVTHFSMAGMERCLRQLGAKELRFIRAGLWIGYLAGF